MSKMLMNLCFGLSPYIPDSEGKQPSEEEEKHKFVRKRILLSEDYDLKWKIAEEILTSVGFE